MERVNTNDGHGEDLILTKISEIIFIVINGDDGVNKRPAEITRLYFNEYSEVIEDYWNSSYEALLNCDCEYE